MNKNLKRIIAIALAIGTVSAVAPAKTINFLTTKAYASSSDTNDNTTLDELKLKNSSGNEIKLYSSDSYSSDDKIDSSEVSDGDTYYAKTSSKTVNIDVEGPESKYVRVFKGKSSSTKGKSIANDIDLNSGTTILVVRVYSDKPDSSIEYGDDGYESEYTIKVKYTGSDDSSDSSDSSGSASTDASDYDDIYLDKLTVDGENISLSDSKVAYTYNVSNSTNSVTIKALPDDTDNDTVSIDGYSVSDSDNWKKNVSLKEGENKIEIDLQDDSNGERIYTLTINRAKAATTTTNTGTTQTGTTTTAKVGWVSVNGRWQYFDSLGRQYRGQWLYDMNYGKWYYLGADGNMYTGWLLDGGKYYYLNSDGSMAVNTTIGGYKVGANGAWIG